MGGGTGLLTSKSVPGPVQTLGEQQLYDAEFLHAIFDSFHGAYVGDSELLGHNYDLNFDEKQLELDSKKYGLFRAKSWIEHDNSNFGAFFGQNFKAETKICTYNGRLAVIIVEKGEQATVNQYWGLHTRAIQLQTQPFRVDGVLVRLEVVGSMNSVATYFNTVYSDGPDRTTINTDYPFYSDLSKQFDFVAEPHRLFNVEFRQAFAADFDSKTKAFRTFKAFHDWVMYGPVEIYTTRDVQSQEEGYIPYNKVDIQK